MRAGIRRLEAFRLFYAEPEALIIFGRAQDEDTCPAVRRRAFDNRPVLESRNPQNCSCD